MISVTIDAAVVAAAVGAVSAALATRWFLKPYEARTSADLARLQSELDSERDERKALRDRVDVQEKKRFDVLHEQRTQVMRETYATLCDLSDAFDSFAGSFGGFVGGPGPMDYWTKMQEAGNAFRRAFWPNRILFEKSLAADLAALNRAYVAVGNTFFGLLAAGVNVLPEHKRTDEAKRKAEYDALQKLYESTPYKDALDRIGPLERKIEEAFRRLYGAE